ncbi:MAG: hypothetical protein AB7O59_05885 [Pirellulales bacterium]
MSGTSGTFDGYHVWLGIPPAEQPPNHYRLLGISLFEKDADVIDHAADRQMAHVRTFQAGKNGAVSQQLLNELAGARLCLLNPAKKASYDEQLRSKISAAPKAVPLMPPTAAVPKATPVAPVAKAVPLAAPVNQQGGGSGILSGGKPGQGSGILSGGKASSGSGILSDIKPGSGSGIFSDSKVGSGSAVFSDSRAGSGSGVLSGIVPAAGGSSASGSKVGTATVVGAKAVVGTKPAVGAKTVAGGKTTTGAQPGATTVSGVRASKAAADLGLEVDVEAMDALTSSPDFRIELPRRGFSRDYAWKRPVALGIMAGVVAVSFFLVYMLGRSLMRNEELKQFIWEGPKASSEGALPPPTDAETGAAATPPPAPGQ